MKYRSEIDGLRAIAVIPVILFHAGFHAFSGGFIGVDIFFVISGYLISIIIFSEIESQEFSILRFYERRARRILPALFFMLICTLPFAYFWMLPFELKAFGENLAGVALFVSNLTLWAQGGYFGGPAELKPLLHTWSLAVEEQFYVFYPLAIILATRLSGWRSAATLIVIVSLVSLYLAEMGVMNHPTINFYLLPTRAWELGAGAMCAIYLFRRPAPKTGGGNEIMAMLGIVLIFYAIASFDQGTPMPSYWGLIPVSGTMLLILFGENSKYTKRILASPPLVGIGLISYSAYLWHQPIFALARIRLNNDLSTGLLLVLVGASILFGYLSWRFVERPLRDRNCTSRKTIFVGAVAGLVLTLSVAGAIILTRGMPDRYPPEVRSLISETMGERGAYAEGAYNSNARDRSFTPGKKHLLLIGDSYSQDLYNMIIENGAFKGYEISAAYIPAKCQIYMGKEDIHQFVARNNFPYCSNPNNLVSRRIIDRAGNADVIIFAASWQPWAAIRLSTTLKAFGFSKSQKVYVLGRKQFGKVNYRHLLKMQPATYPKIRVKPLLPQKQVDRILQNEKLPAIYVDLESLVCDAPDSCPQFTPKGDLISHDGGHLTQAGARYIGQILFTKTALAVYARENVAEDGLNR